MWRRTTRMVWLYCGACFFVAWIAGCGLGGNLTLDPNTSLSPFAVTKVGEAQIQAIKLYNEGSTPLTISEIVVSDKTGQDQGFSLPSLPTFPLIVEPGQSKGIAVSIKFQGQRVGAAASELQIRYTHVNSPDVRLFSQELLGSVAEAPKPGTLLFSTKAGLLDFGTFTTRDVRTRDLKFWTEGGKSLTIQGVRFAGNTSNVFRIEFPPPFPFVLDPGQSLAQALIVTVSAAKPGTYLATLLITSPDAVNRDANNQVALQLKATVETYRAPPNLYVENSSSLIFENVEVGKSPTKTITLKNKGEQPLPIEGIRIVQDPNGHAAFSVVDAPTWPKVLAAQQSASFKIKVDVTRAKGAVAALLIKAPKSTNVDERGERRVQIELFYRRAVGVVRCGDEMGPPTIDFGEREIATRPALFCSIQNVGSSELLLGRVSYMKKSGENSPFVITSPNFPTRIRQGRTVSVRIEFRPTATTPTLSEGTFVFDSNHWSDTTPKEKLTITLKGRSRKP